MYLSFSLPGPVPLRLGPSRRQVCPASGRQAQALRPPHRRGGRADASTARLQHPQNRQRRHAHLPAAHRRSVPVYGPGPEGEVQDAHGSTSGLGSGEI